MGREDSDEAYVLDLCDERQHDQPTAFFDKTDQLTISGVHRGEQRALYDARRDSLIPAQGLRLVVIRPGKLDANAQGRLRRRDRERDLDAVRGILRPPPMPAVDADGSSAEPTTRLPRLMPSQKRGDEERVVAAFEHWLIAEGWTLVTPTDPYTDIEAVRASERLIGEAKGRCPCREPRPRTSPDTQSLPGSAA
jgi:hypothetical protein